jgi:hypothetical protein
MKSRLQVDLPALLQDQGLTHQPYLVLHTLVLGVTFRSFGELIRDLLTDSFYRSTWQSIQKRGGPFDFLDLTPYAFVALHDLRFYIFRLLDIRTTGYRLCKAGSL